MHDSIFGSTNRCPAHASDVPDNPQKHARSNALLYTLLLLATHMSKLLKLKEWLTLEDAAKHLSNMFSEEVSVADLLQFCLHGHLTLSVNIINGAKAKFGKITPIEETDWTFLPGFGDIDSIRVPNGILIDSNRILKPSGEVASITGIYDLPMIGGEALDVQHKYHQITGGPAVTLHCLNGVFLKLDDIYYQMQDQFNKGKRSKSNYYPMACLPDDSIMVIRTAELLRFQSTANEDLKSNTEIGTREKDTLLKLVIGMALAAYKYDPSSGKSHVPAEIASDLQGLGIPMTDDTVRKWLKEARDTVLQGKK
ncbi:MAG: hypothetical protein AB9M53_07165 [Leptothrix sp. (in: b-proteobacteria)]